MEPVIAGAVVTVVVSVVNGLVRIAQRIMSASVEKTLITEAGQTNRVRCLTSQAVLTSSAPTPESSDAGPHGYAGGDDRGGRPQY